jgi:hypothetical protein
MRAYSQTPAGKAAKQRSHQRYIQKRRELSEKHELSIDAKPLEQALTHWRTT